MQQVTLEEATARLSELIKKASEGGEEVLITENSIAVAKLVPLTERPRQRRAGTARGLFTMSRDFDAPLEDFAAYQ